MFVHSVYFWLKPDLTKAERSRFHQGVRRLLTIPTISQGFIGTPPKSDRPVVDDSYSCVLILMFATAAAHDTYQSHPIHETFRKDCGELWEHISVYDAIG